MRCCISSPLMADIVILVLFPDTAIDSVAAFGSTPGMGIPGGIIWSFALLDDVSPISPCITARL
jgi:hypothetical protein